MTGDVELAPVSGEDGSRALRTSFGRFPSGVVALCAVVDGAPVGMAASSFTSLSLDPPLVLVCVDRASTTWPRLRGADRLGVSVLGEAHDAAARQLASRTADRFAGLDLATSADGALLVHGATAWLDCSLEEELPGGDHLIVVLRVHGHRALDDQGPLVFHDSGFGRLAPG